MTPLSLYHYTVASLTTAGISDSEAEASLLVCHILGCRRSDIFLRRETSVSDSALAQVEQALARRRQREPLAYILGEQEFYGRTFTVSPAVLIPRPETELLVEKAIAHIRQQAARPRILDLGTGSGIIAITLALESPAARVVAVDISLPALRVAQANARSLGAAGRIDWLNADWGAALVAETGFSLVAANPPYVAKKIADSLQPELACEPARALYGGEDGCLEIDRIMADAHRLLCPGGVLLMEIGFDQGGYVLDRMRTSGHYDRIEVHSDYAGLPRILEARRRLS